MGAEGQPRGESLARFNFGPKINILAFTCLPNRNGRTLSIRAKFRKKDRKAFCVEQRQSA